MKKIIIRLDDISWDMNYDKFMRIKDILCKYNVNPLIGVIPENRDRKLEIYRNESSKQISPEKFWMLIKHLQDDEGWEIALHGCYHVYKTHEAGLLRLNRRSEFAGVDLNEQKKMISYGKNILEKHGLTIYSFMAPAHSFDRNTIKALTDNGITCITDGYALYPYKWNSCLFIPQVNAIFSAKGIGYSTICLHVNEWDDMKFKSFEKFVDENKKCFVGFRDTIEDYESESKLYWEILNRLYSVYYITRRSLSKMKHYIIKHTSDS